MRPIVLVGLGARWAHTSLGLRCLKANLGRLQDDAVLVERPVADPAVAVVEEVLALDPELVGLGVYIWNVARVSQVVALLKRLRPDLPVVLGGPEVSFEHDAPPVAELADWVIAGEAEVAFRHLCEGVAEGRVPRSRYIVAQRPDLDRLELPYHLYDARDIAQRTLYVEAARGCPFGCEFCLSSLDPAVRRVPLPRLLAALDELWRRGARQFKWVDRALHLAIGPEILGFFLERYEPGTFLHLELIPEHLPRSVTELIGRFPDGAIQLEAGVQTFDPAVAARVSRRQQREWCEYNLRHLRQHTGAHLHVDLIAGLPGETRESFAAGFDRLVEMTPHEIQVVLLKRLRGTDIGRHDGTWGMVYNPDPPYEVLETSTLGFDEVMRLRRFARVVDLVFNSGNFKVTAPLLWHAGSPFSGLMGFADWLGASGGEHHGIALHRLARLLYQYLVGECEVAAERARSCLDRDYRRLGRPPIPLDETTRPSTEPAGRSLARQRRHHADEDQGDQSR